MKLKNHQGFTLIEGIASIFIISLIIVFTLTVVINVQRRSAATRAQIAATEIGAMIREDVETDATYDDVASWMAGREQTLTSTTCSRPGSPYACSLFAYENDGTIFADVVTIVFLEPTADSINYRIIHFSITIVYFDARVITLEGMIIDE
ncbi:MAG: type II secretion system protein [bacterium]